MSLRSGEAALGYHEATKHSPRSIRSVPHFLDWDNQPLAFKIYRDVPQVPLPPPPEPSGMDALDAIEASGGRAGSRTLDVESLSRLLHYTAGITKHLRMVGGSMPFRAAACTGALYHVEIYLASGPIDALEAGLYHYDPREHSLDRLREGDWRGALVEATGEEPGIERASAVLVLTSTYWRNAWKYRARAYRHSFWDSGTMLANLFATGASLSLPLHLVLGFADDAVHDLLGVDPAKEAAVALVAVPGPGKAPAPLPEKPPELALATVPLSRDEVDYPAIREMQRKSSLASGGEAREWRESGSPVRTRHEGAAELRRLEPATGSGRSGSSIEEIIRKRGSSRRFARDSIGFRELSTILGAAARGLSSDSMPEDVPVVDPYVIVNGVGGLASGSYAFHPAASGLEPLREGDFRKEAGFLDLEQELAADASVNVYALVDLAPLLARYGSRGYRVAQLAGGIFGGRLYLAAYSLGLGATGLTFYDDAVTDFFSPHASGKSVMFLTAIGASAARKVLFQK